MKLTRVVSDLSSIVNYLIRKSDMLHSVPWYIKHDVTLTNNYLWQIKNRYEL